MPDDKPLARVDVDKLLDKRPPLPPPTSGGKWDWTRDRLKAVYLDAFTSLEKQQIAEAVGIDVRTLYNWRRAPEYKNYLAVLIAGEGLADRAERVKSRRALAEELGERLAARLRDPDALDGEKISSVLRAHRDLLDSLAADADGLREAAEAAGPARAARPDVDLVGKIEAIADPGERAAAKRLLLGLMADYLDVPRVQTPATPGDVFDIAPEGPERPENAPERPREASGMPDPGPSAGAPENANPGPSREPEGVPGAAFEPDPEPERAPEMRASDLEF